MTQDEIIRMAREAGLFNPHNEDLLQDKEVMAQFERFAALVAAHEREKYELVGAVIEAFTEKPTDKSVTPEYLDWMRGKSCVGGNEAWNAGVAYEREACAMVCEEEAEEWAGRTEPHEAVVRCAASIRARGYREK